MLLPRLGRCSAPKTRFARPQTLPCSLRRPSSSSAPTPPPSSSPPTRPAYFTTPIFYPSAQPHVGHLHSLVLTDVLARYAALRQPDRTVKMATGTDEHGLKIQQAARKAGLSEQEFTRQLSARFKDLADKAGINYSTFIRTSEPRHYESVSHLWNDLMGRGHIYKGKHEGWYAISDECFYPTNQVQDVETSEGVKKVSIETGSVVEWTAEENYKFRLSAFQDRLIEWLESSPAVISPPKYTQMLLHSLRSEPLEDLSISRPSTRLSWGVPVPHDEGHTIYVWFDALINYLTVLGFPNEGWERKGWPASLQILGKDIVRFHAIYWPALLFAADLPPPTQLLVHAHWTMNKAKMSKSTGNVADPVQAMDKAGVESVRAYLMGVGGDLRDDADYNYANLTQYHKVLSDQIGNLLLRATGRKILSRLGTFSSAPSRNPLTSDPSDEALERALVELRSAVDRHLDSHEVGKAVESVLAVVSLANAHYSALKPWEKETDVEQVVRAVFYSISTLRVAALMLMPIMPDRMGRLLDKLGVDGEERVWERTRWLGLEEEERLAEGWIEKVKEGVKKQIGGKVIFDRIDEDP